MMTRAAIFMSGSSSSSSNNSLDDFKKGIIFYGLRFSLD